MADKSFPRACSALAAWGMNSHCCHPCPFPSLKALLKSIQGDHPHQATFIGSRRERRGNIFTFFWNIRWKISLGKKSAYAALVTVHVLWIVWNPICFFSAESWSPHERGRQTGRPADPATMTCCRAPSRSCRQVLRNALTACICRSRWVGGRGGDIPP